MSLPLVKALSVDGVVEFELLRIATVYQALAHRAANLAQG